LAQAGFALNYGVMRMRGFVRPDEGVDMQKRAVDRDLTLDESLPEAHLAASVLCMEQYDWAGAERSMKRAIELNPNYLHGWSCYAFLLRALGRKDDALAARKRVIEMDPVSDYGSKDYADSLIRAGRSQEAIAQAQKAVELRPDFAPAHDVLGVAYF